MKKIITISILFFVFGLSITYFIMNYDFSREKKSSVTPAKSDILSNESIKEFLVKTKFRDYQNEVFQIQLENLEQKDIVIHLWASWCDPCINEIPEILSYVKRNPSTIFVMVSSDYEIQDIGVFAKSFPDILDKKLIQIWDFDGSLAKFFNADRLPMSIIINSKKNEPQIIKSVVRWDSI